MVLSSLLSPFELVKVQSFPAMITKTPCCDPDGNFLDLVIPISEHLHHVFLSLAVSRGLGAANCAKVTAMARV